MRRRFAFRPIRRKPSRRTSRTVRRLLLFVIFLTVLSGVALTVQITLRPIVERLAMARVNYIAGRAINDAINDQIVEGDINYDTLIQLEKDTEGHITALKTNMIVINQFKATILGVVLEKIQDTDRSLLQVPLGNIFNNALLSGRGPGIPIVIVPVGSADAKFISALTAAGINQTRHQIIVEVTVHMSVLLPGFRASSDVSSQVNIAETIIVGTVPEAYTYLEDTGQSGMDIYGDFDLNPNRDP